MSRCPVCRGKLEKDIENVQEMGDSKQFDVRLSCPSCGYTKQLALARKNPIPRTQDKVAEMTAPLKLRQYLPERKLEKAPTSFRIKREPLTRMLSPLKRTKDLFIYGGAILLGVAIEIAGLYFESYLRMTYMNPSAGFFISLLIFVLAPITIVGAAVYYMTRDRLKAVLLGSFAVPLTIIILAKLRLDTWGL